MLVLPLGLGTKLRRIPFVTLTIAAIWIMVFALDHSEEHITAGLVAAVAKSGVRDASRSLFVEYCLDHHGSQALCDRYAVLVWTGFPAKAGAKMDVRREAKAGLRSLRMGPAQNRAIVHEEQQADHLRDNLSDCGRSSKCLVYKDLLWSFLGKQRPHQAHAALPLTDLDAYGDFRRAEQVYLSELRQLCRDYECLVPGHITLGSLVWAQVRHGGLLHLFGNLVTLLLFGAYVEQRTSRLLYLLGLIVGGTLGMAIHTYFFGDNDAIALGGSANVSAIMGMFYVFFFRSRMRFLVWLPRKIYLGTPFFADVRYCFPLFFVLADITGSLNSGLGELLGTKVAHVAHLVGLLVGAGIGLAIVKWRRLPSQLIFEGEVADLHRLARTHDPLTAIHLATAMLGCNPENIRARELGCVAALKLPLQTRGLPTAATFAAGGEGQAFLSEHLSTICAVHARRGSLRFVVSLLQRLPASLDLQLFLSRLGQLNILKIADYAAGHGSLMLALRLYDFFLLRFPLSVKFKSIESSAADVINRLPPLAETLDSARLYLAHHPDSLVAARLGAWYTNRQNAMSAAAHANSAGDFNGAYTYPEAAT